MWEKELTKIPGDANLTENITDKTYTAETYGQDGILKVKVVITNGKISTVSIIEHHETESIASQALEELPKSIVESNSLNIDVIVAATLTSKRIGTAVANCLKQATK